MTEARRKLLRAVLWLAFGLIALVNTGCLLAVAGAGAAGAAAAAGYAYYNGLLYRDYKANLADTILAVRTSLQELQFPVLDIKTDTGSSYIRTRTADDHTVRIYLDVVPSPIPAEGAMTRVAIRVGFSGDDAVSARIIDQISHHLATPLVPAAAPPGTPLVTTGAPPGSPTLLPPRPIPETAAPPLAPPVPIQSAH
jgi:hypothetical protein